MKPPNLVLVAEHHQHETRKHVPTRRGFPRRPCFDKASIMAAFGVRVLHAEWLQFRGGAHRPMSTSLSVVALDCAALALVWHVKEKARMRPWPEPEPGPHLMNMCSAKVGQERYKSGRCGVSSCRLHCRAQVFDNTILLVELWPNPRCDTRWIRPRRVITKTLSRMHIRLLNMDMPRLISTLCNSLYWPLMSDNLQIWTCTSSVRPQGRITVEMED
jgi:hypothetical protein